jgi:hypothetical protein
MHFHFHYHITLLCLNPLHVSGVKRPSSGGITLAVFGERALELLTGCKLWADSDNTQTTAISARSLKNF